MNKTYVRHCFFCQKKFDTDEDPDEQIIVSINTYQGIDGIIEIHFCLKCWNRASDNSEIRRFDIGAWVTFAGKEYRPTRFTNTDIYPKYRIAAQKHVPIDAIETRYGTW